VYDPWANAEEVSAEFKLKLSKTSDLKNNYDAVVLAVAHTEFSEFNLDAHTNKPSVVFDVKSFLPKGKVDGRL
jgi:UDP-N-acetyl-D-galactosamine dehydrogenase